MCIEEQSCEITPLKEGRRESHTRRLHKLCELLKSFVLAEMKQQVLAFSTLLQYNKSEKVKSTILWCFDYIFIYYLLLNKCIYLYYIYYIYIYNTFLCCYF